MTPKHNVEVQSFPKLKMTVMCLMEKISVRLASFRHKFSAAGHEFNVN